MIACLLSGCENPSTNPSLVETGTVTDVDGNTYTTVKIGDQWWMSENLRVTRFRDGTAIPNAGADTEWTEPGGPAYCDYDNDSTHVATYGRLYNFHVVNAGRQIAPEGWHVPTLKEWQTLIEYAGGEDVAGGNLKERGTAHWEAPNEGATDTYGFGAVAGGYRDAEQGHFLLKDDYGHYWTQYSSGSYYGWAAVLFDYKAAVSLQALRERTGASIRCIKNQ